MPHSHLKGPIIVHPYPTVISPWKSLDPESKQETKRNRGKLTLLTQCTRKSINKLPTLGQAKLIHSLSLPPACF